MAFSTTDLEKDIAEWLIGFIDWYPERVRKSLFEKAQAYRQEVRHARLTDLSAPALTIKTLGNKLDEWAKELLTPAEFLETSAKKLTDRKLLEAIYRKLHE